MPSPHRRQLGFSLIEIAVVLVIVGLLIGGVMKGQEMIGSAKVKNLGQDLRNVGSFAFAYQDKYRALPGDDAAAAAHVSGTALTGANVGNGRIDGDWNATSGTESSQFWEHIRKAGLAGGSTDTTAGEYIPKNANGGPIGVTSTAPISGWTGNLFACTASVTGAIARQLDISMDDGNTSTGSLRVIAAGNVASGAGVAVTPADDATLYTVCMAL